MSKQFRIEELVKVKQDLRDQIKLDEYWLNQGIGGHECLRRMMDNKAAYAAVCIWIAETQEQIKQDELNQNAG